MKFLTKTLRYPSADLYMLLSCVIAFITLIISLNYLGEIWKYNDDKKDYEYKYAHNVEIRSENTMADVLGVLDSAECNVILRKELTISDGIKTINVNANIIWAENEEAPLKELNDFVSSKNGENICMVGKGICEYLKKGKGDYLIIDGKSYRIANVLECSSDYYDGDVFLVRSNIDESLEESIRQSNVVSLDFLSNKSDCTDEMSVIISDMKDVNSKLNITVNKVEALSRRIVVTHLSN